MSRAWLAPLNPPYAAAVALKNAAYDRKWLQAKRLRWPVISVGNLSVGGAGKTPVVIRLAELLGDRGVAVSVLSRGYGRDSAAVEVVEASGPATRFGDEPLLIARRIVRPGNGAQVVVGANRYAAGQLAEQGLERPSSTGPGQSSAVRTSGVHLLDDGFQHRRLARDVDIVVLHRSDFEERLLPAGRLREPLSSLRRATVLVLREEDADLEAALRQRGIGKLIWWVRRAVEIPDAPETPGGATGAVAFCGIARPAEFFNSLRRAGVTVLRERAFPDHHRFSFEEVDNLHGSALECGADAFLTTEKDAVRLDPPLLARLTGQGGGGQVVPLHTAELRATFRNEDHVIGDLLRLIAHE